MSVKSPLFSARGFVSKRKSLFVPVLTLAICASTGWAQAPPIVVDAQQTIGKGYNQPQSLAISSNGTIFVPDTIKNQIACTEPHNRRDHTHIYGDDNVVGSGVTRPGRKWRSLRGRHTLWRRG